jgi:Fe-S oxidoreductase/FAD/FMN-containing dehydrogenase
MLGNNSCGIHSLISHNAGLGLRTSDNTHELEIVTYRGLRLRVGPTSPEELQSIVAEGGPRGELYRQLKAFRDKYADLIRERFPKLPRRVSGYNLDELLPENGFHVARSLVGSEGTLVTILEATLHLVPSPGSRSLLVLGYPTIYEACKHLLEILKFHPTGLEGLDHLLFQSVKSKGDEEDAIELMPAGKGFLMVEFGGDSKEASDEVARRCMERLEKQSEAPSMKLFDDAAEEEKLWKVREGGLGSTAWVQGKPDAWPGWEDSAVSPERVHEYLPRLRDLLQKYGYDASLYGHFGQGCIHTRIPFDLYSAEGVRAYRSFMSEAADLVVEMGGSLSGEHGDGQARAELLPKMFGSELVQAFAEFKQIWDPDARMNPGKIVDPYPMDANLRIGPDYHPPQPETHFQFAESHYSFARAALRCVGVGNCRRLEGGVMCPSYMATREEKHSTRGRAHLLFEMLNGEVLTDGWKSEEVRESLDLCLACKGCKSDCPVNVDMATYKAEFLSHYYEGRLRPRHAYAMGWIFWWARLASHVPRIVNFFGQTPVLRDIVKWIGGIAPQRTVPRFAPRTFKHWWRHRAPKNLAGSPVILWSDTFTNHFHPDIARAAVEVLEHFGHRVEVPCEPLCCGRPLYDFGMLDTAKALLRQILAALRPAIRESIPIIVLEPSCLAVFRDELVQLYPNDLDARRLKDLACSLSEFLARHDADELPNLEARAIVHAHCHHRSVIGFDVEEKLLGQMGIEVEMPESSCCGMAGSFGFERGEHYAVAMTCGERNLLPAVRTSAEETLVIADGFSCHEQIFQGTGRRPLHFAQVVRNGLKIDRSSNEVELSESRQRMSVSTMLMAGSVALAATVAGLWILKGERHETR